MPGTHFHSARRAHRHRAGLVLIALYKLLGALLFIAVGIGALRLIHKDIDDVMWHALVEVLHWNPESRVVNFLFEKAELLNDPILRKIGLAAFCYAAVGVLEAVGLYLEKTWGELLTIIITASFLPLELNEIFHRVTWVRVSLFLANAAVFLYLLWLLGERAAEKRREYTTHAK